MKDFKVLIAMTVVLMLGFGTYLFAAGKGNRAGRGGWLNNCPAAKNLSDEERQKVLTEMQAFRKDTDTLRQEIQQKRLDLRTEIRKSSTDSQKAFSMQKEISDLEAQIAQKRVQHLIDLKNINPALSECLERSRRPDDMRGQRSRTSSPQNTQNAVDK